MKADCTPKSCGQINLYSEDHRQMKADCVGGPFVGPFFESVKKGLTGPEKTRYSNRRARCVQSLGFCCMAGAFFCGGFLMFGRSQARVLEAYGDVFRTSAGRMVLADILAASGAFRAVELGAVRGVSADILLAHENGKRAVGFDIANKAGLSPADLHELMKESFDDGQ